MDDESNEEVRLTADGRKYTPKSTAAELARRVDIVMRMQSEGHDRPSIIQYGMQEWGVTDRTVDNYIKRAVELLKESYTRKADEHAAEIYSWIRYHYKRATLGGELPEGSDQRVALQAAAQMAKLLGVNFSDRVPRGESDDKKNYADELRELLGDVYPRDDDSDDDE